MEQIRQQPSLANQRPFTQYRQSANPFSVSKTYDGSAIKQPPSCWASLRCFRRLDRNRRGLKAAQAIVVPMLLAAFIATIAAGPMFWFKSKGTSNGPALSSVVLGIFLALG